MYTNLTPGSDNPTHDGVAHGGVEPDAEAGVGEGAVARRLEAGKPQPAHQAVLVDRRARQQKCTAARAASRAAHGHLPPHLEHLQGVEEGVGDGAPALQRYKLSLTANFENDDISF
jgi:hypothetical protein